MKLFESRLDKIGKNGEKRGKVILDFLKARYLDEKATRMLCDFLPKRLEKRNCFLFVQEMLKMEDRGTK